MAAPSPAAGAPPSALGSPEALQAGLEAKRAEALLLRARLRAARLGTEHLRLRLGAAEPSLVPTRMNAGSGAPEPQQLSELRSLLQWLVESVDLSRHVVFDCGGEVTVGGRRVLLQRMATWQLSGGVPGGHSDAQLKLSVPLDLQAEIAGMLAAARQQGGRMDEAVVQRLADAWEMVGTEVVSAAMGCPEPAIFLVHRESARAITVTQWPSVEFARAAPGGGFDPDRHFARLAAERAPAPTMPHKVHVPQIPSQGVDAPPPVLSVSMGDRVEVECEGHWFTGVLQCVNGDLANIQCDEASPGAITVALASVRPARSAQDVTPKKCARHMRAKSAG